MNMFTPYRSYSIIPRTASSNASQNGRNQSRQSPYAQGLPSNISTASLRSRSSASSTRNDRESSASFWESRSSSPISTDDDPMTAKTPTFEYYGFVMYLVSFVAFITYLLWAYLPDSALEAVGISYYPDRYWALAIPSWWLMTIFFIYIFNMAANMYNTPLLDSIDTITDPYSNLPDDNDEFDMFYCDEVGGIPPISDLPISFVNKCLYQKINPDIPHAGNQL